MAPRDRVLAVLRRSYPQWVGQGYIEAQVLATYGPDELLAAPDTFDLRDLTRQLETEGVVEVDSRYKFRLRQPTDQEFALGVVTEQPQPTGNANPAVWEAVIEDMRARDRLGRETYGVPLQPGNGRDAVRDALDESLDQSVYLKQLQFELRQLGSELREYRESVVGRDSFTAAFLFLVLQKYPFLK